MSGQQLLDQMLQAKPLFDSVLIVNREKYLYQMYLSDCRDRGLEPSVEAYVEWKRVEYPLIIQAQEFVNNLERPF